MSVEVYKALEKTGTYMLRAIALYLNLPENYFDNKIASGNSILRPIHYFPIENPDAVPADAVRAELGRMIGSPPRCFSAQ